MNQPIFLCVALLMSELALSALAGPVFFRQERERTIGTKFPYYKALRLGEIGTTFNPKGKPGFCKERGILIVPMDTEGWCLGFTENKIGVTNAPLTQDLFCSNSLEFHLIEDKESTNFYIIPIGSGLCLGNKGNLDLPRFSPIVQAECTVGNQHQLWWFEESGDDDNTVWIHQMSSGFLVYGSRVTDLPVTLIFNNFLGNKTNESDVRIDTSGLSLGKDLRV